MAQGGAINIGILAGAAIGILTLAVVIMLGPTIGGSMEEAMPALSATSEWNSSYNTDANLGVIANSEWKYTDGCRDLGTARAVPDRCGYRDPRSDHHLRDQGRGIG